MGFRSIIVLAVLMGVRGSPTPEAASADVASHTKMTPKTAEETGQNLVLGVEENVMATGELNPNHYPAQRAAKVVQHYLNTRHGSPYRLFGLKRVYSGNAEDVADSGRKYQLEISVHEIISNTTQKCSAEVFFPQREKPLLAQVKASPCEELLNNDTQAQEEALYQQYKNNQSLLSAQHLPDSYGHIEPDMKPFWHLAIVASSSIMLKESTQDTLYNMAQVANITQLATENEQLKFQCHVLLHEMVSQEILHWKLLFTWSSAGGVNVLEMEQLPHCHDCEKPSTTN
ncbi:latexin isoform 1-T1 [Odontesthes bonariensis]|uniref:latexin isoform X1 n=2 Tax=Odontesthes bonariensis TaxID=219752 RepID=UPI003F582CC8